MSEIWLDYRLPSKRPRCSAIGHGAGISAEVKLIGKIIQGRSGKGFDEGFWRGKAVGLGVFRGRHIFWNLDIRFQEQNDESLFLVEFSDSTSELLALRYKLVAV